MYGAYTASKARPESMPEAIMVFFPTGTLNVAFSGLIGLPNV